MKKKILAGILFIVFIFWTVLVKMDLLVKFDEFFYKLITSSMNNTLTTIFKIITFFGSTVFMIIFALVLFIYFILKKKNIISYLTSSCLIISTILNNVIKIIIRRSRPDVIKLVTETSFSYPSGHTMASVSIYGIIIYLLLNSNINKTVKYISSVGLSLLILLIGISRIYLGAHYMSDIIGAMLVSTIWLLIFTSIIEDKKWLKKEN